MTLYITFTDILFNINRIRISNIYSSTNVYLLQNKNTYSFSK